MSQKRSILVSHPWMGRGGSEATAMWTLEALQDDYEVTFVTASPLDWEELNGAYGSHVDPLKVKVIKAPVVPTVDGPLKLVLWQNRYFEKFCNRIAGDYDLCLSAYNPVFFGKPGIQLLGDFSFSEDMRKRLYIYGESNFKHKESLVRKVYLAVGNLFGVKRPPLRERGDLVLSNSQWCVDQLGRYFGIGKSAVIYPPVILPAAAFDTERDPLGFVCLGRVVPEKEIERIIRILAALREKGYPATLKLIGNLDDSEYSRHLAQVLERHGDWIEPVGFLELEEKQRILSEQTFAIHACRIEAFGIAVAEMASMGCVPIVPATGGAVEIVPHSELQYETDEEAVSKLLDLIEHPGKVEALRGELLARVGQFGPDVFMRELREHVLAFAASRC
ncbi:MAG: glycosyltransferase family 4 protein [Verrucomicrobiales bacterium]|nr:glycosyltransferase family 4 protein [Verrucomicrobiales bacterium]